MHQTGIVADDRFASCNDRQGNAKSRFPCKIQAAPRGSRADLVAERRLLARPQQHDGQIQTSRQRAMEQYLDIVKASLDIGVRPRCHFEDITRADFYGFVVPFALKLKDLMDESGIPIKIRACDTMGYGICYPGAALPRSVPGIIYGLYFHAGFPSSLIEWHGHNDFYKAVTNAGTAWLYGASAVNCSLLGIGERTGNTPLEAMVIEYSQLRGTTDEMDLTVITEIAKYYEHELGYEIPPMTPFVGKKFNTTQAGIHADGLLKDEEIYNIFNTDKLLNRPVAVTINVHSGVAGIVHWINDRFCRGGLRQLDKKHPEIIALKEWVDQQYAQERVTAIGDDELEQAMMTVTPELYAQLSGEAEIK